MEALKLSAGEKVIHSVVNLVALLIVAVVSSSMLAILGKHLPLDSFKDQNFIDLFPMFLSSIGALVVTLATIVVTLKILISPEFSNNFISEYHPNRSYGSMEASDDLRPRGFKTIYPESEPVETVESVEYIQEEVDEDVNSEEFAEEYISEAELEQDEEMLAAERLEKELKKYNDLLDGQGFHFKLNIPSSSRVEAPFIIWFQRNGVGVHSTLMQLDFENSLPRFVTECLQLVPAYSTVE